MPRNIGSVEIVRSLTSQSTAAALLDDFSNENGSQSIANEDFDDTAVTSVSPTSVSKNYQTLFVESWSSPVQADADDSNEKLATCGGEVMTSRGSAVMNSSPLVTKSLSDVSYYYLTRDGHPRFVDTFNNYYHVQYHGYTETSTCQRGPQWPTNDDASCEMATMSYTDHVTKWLRDQTCDGTVRRRRKVTKKQRAAANIRERRRMHQLNDAFTKLRTVIPVVPLSSNGLEPRPLSRIQTLRLAIEYISFMSDVLDRTPNESVSTTTTDSLNYDVTAPNAHNSSPTLYCKNQNSTHVDVGDCSYSSMHSLQICKTSPVYFCDKSTDYDGEKLSVTRRDVSFSLATTS